MDGYWSAWQDWGMCSQSCGDGMQTRQRTCSFPFPLNQGDSCPGSSQEARGCNKGVCQGAYTVLNDWININRENTIKKKTFCSDTKKWYQQRASALPLLEYGVWSQWGAWEKCSVSCNNGTKSRERVCTTQGALCLKMNGEKGEKERMNMECNMEACNRKDSTHYSVLIVRDFTTKHLSWMKTIVFFRYCFILVYYSFIVR